MDSKEQRPQFKHRNTGNSRKNTGKTKSPPVNRNLGKFQSYDREFEPYGGSEDAKAFLLWLKAEEACEMLKHNTKNQAGAEFKEAESGLLEADEHSK